MSNNSERSIATKAVVNYPRGSGRWVASGESLQESQTAVKSQAPDLELSPPENNRVRRRNQQLEFEEQHRYFQEIDLALREGKPEADMIYAVPNSNVAGLKVGRKLVASGLRRGYPDINVDAARVVNGFPYHRLRIEMKQATGVLSDVATDQREWHERLRDAGYKGAVCFGWREALAVTSEYLAW